MARLATKLGIDVRLRPTDGGGTTAVVLLPASLLAGTAIGMGPASITPPESPVRGAGAPLTGPPARSSGLLGGGGADPQRGDHEALLALSDFQRAQQRPGPGEDT